MDYTATQLAKMFKISRTTVYSKFEHQELNKYVHDTEQGKKLDKEGLDTLRILLANSKVNVQQNTTVTTEKTAVYEQYINSLLEQITYLKKEVDDLKNKNELLTNHLLQRDRLMLESEEQKKSGFFKRLFK